MITFAWIVLAAFVLEVAHWVRIRRARRNAYALGVDHARNVALTVADGCRQGDGLDAYEIGRHSGAMDTFNQISYLLTRTA